MSIAVRVRIALRPNCRGRTSQLVDEGGGYAMKHLMAYAQSQDVTLDGEKAFEELYTRLARWTTESIDAYRDDRAEAGSQGIERCIALLGYMNHAIDLSHNYVIACAVLSLHRFVIGTLVKAKAE